MTLWTLVQIKDSPYAVAGLRGAWSPGKLCPECTGSTERRVPPLVIEWEPGPDVVADFTSTGFDSDFIITTRVCEALRRFRGFDPGRVEMIERAKRSRSRSGIRLPYQGPEVFELWLTHTVPINRMRSSARLVRRCPLCGTERWEASGIERFEYDVDPKTPALSWRRIPKVPGQGLVVRAADIHDAGVFRVAEFPGWVFCDDQFRNEVVRHNFNNVTFLEAGDVV